MIEEIIALLTGSFIVGLLAQTHCIGMCGPVIGILGMNNQYKRIPAAILYNLGRISTYTLLGLIAGFIGALISDIATIQYIVRYIAGIIMIFVALQLLGLPQFMARIEAPFQVIWRRLQKYSQKFLPIRSAKGTYGIGLVWGFLPCGAVYGPLSVALGTGNIGLSAGMMLAFGLGTLPMMIGLAIFGNFIGRLLIRPKARIFAGLLILTMTVYYLVAIAPKDRVMMRAKQQDIESERLRKGDNEAKQALDQLSMKHQDHNTKGKHNTGKIEK